jgi:hypothetical protein
VKYGFASAFNHVTAHSIPLVGTLLSPIMSGTGPN